MSIFKQLWRMAFELKTLLHLLVTTTLSLKLKNCLNTDGGNIGSSFLRYLNS